MADQKFIPANSEHEVTLKLMHRLLIAKDGPDTATTRSATRSQIIDHYMAARACVSGNWDVDNAKTFLPEANS